MPPFFEKDVIDEHPNKRGVGLVEIAQIGRDAAGLGFDAMAARAILREAGMADFQGEFISAIGIFFEPIIPNGREAGGVDGLGGDIAMRERTLGAGQRETDKQGKPEFAGDERHDFPPEFCLILVSAGKRGIVLWRP